jgi:AhpD family alkylhydroperoxidase
MGGSDGNRHTPAREVQPMTEPVYPTATKELAELRKRLAPEAAEAFKAFSRSVFAEGALSGKVKQLIAVAVAHVTQCPYCIRAHTKTAMQQGATAEEIMEAIWVAAEMRAGGAYAHAGLALDTIARHGTKSAEHEAAAGGAEADGAVARGERS